MLATGATARAQQTTPQTLLKITDPQPGTIVTPGETLAVTVAGPLGTKLRAVLVISQDPIGIESDTSGRLPAHVQLAVPATTTPGKYFVTAMGATTDGQSVDSESVEIDVEYDSAPVLALPEGNRLSFLTPGERLPIHVIGRFGQNSVDVARSTRVTFTSSNPTVAAVGLEGWISPASPGTATITITYRPPRRAPVQTTVSVDVQSPMLSASKYLLDFGEQPVGATGESQSLTLTNNSIGPIRAIKIATTPLRRPMTVLSKSRPRRRAPSR